MPRVFLHIGAPKTASSLIQGLLNEPRSKQIVGPEYLPTQSKVIQSYTPVVDFDDYYTRQIFDDIKRNIPNKDCLLSLENIFGMHTHAPNNYEESVRVIDHLFEGFDIKVLFFIRRQDTYFESIYNQDVKRGEDRPFEQYLSEAMTDNVDWLKVADNYSKYDLTVRPFEKEVLKTARYRDFLDALYKWLGEDVIVEKAPVINPSLSVRGLQMQFVANQILPKQEAYDISLWLEKHCPKAPRETHDLLKDPERLIRQFEESNKKLFEKYLPEFDGSYYWRT